MIARLERLWKVKVFKRSWVLCQNVEIDELVAVPKILDEIKAEELLWLSHLERIGDVCGIKRTYLGKKPGRRPCRSTQILFVLEMNYFKSINKHTINLMS